MYRISAMCRNLNVSKAGYYAWRERGESLRSKRDAELVKSIAEVHERSLTAYGSPRIHAELRDRGSNASRKRVARLMREHAIYGKKKRRFVITTNSRHSFAVAPNLLNRCFTTTAPNRVWVSDITYFSTRQGWLYLAVVIDLFSRRVVGWSMSNRIDVALVIDALQMAVVQRQIAGKVIVHTDRGSQYASTDYRRFLDKHGLVASMSRKGDCWDNAVAESFFATLKLELAMKTIWSTRDEARAAIFRYKHGTTANAGTRRSDIRVQSNTSETAKSPNYPSTKSGQVQGDNLRSATP